MQTQELNLIGALLTADVVEIDLMMVGRNFRVVEPIEMLEGPEAWDDDVVRLEANYVDDDDHEEFRWKATGQDLIAATCTGNGNGWTVRAGGEDEFRIRCYRLKLLRPEQKQEPWADDYVQFARLLAEIKMAGIPPETLEPLKESMDLNSEQIQSIFDRAEERFEEIKASL